MSEPLPKMELQCHACGRTDDILEFYGNGGLLYLKVMKATFSVPEGTISMEWPSEMSDDSRTDALQWLTLMRRRIEKAVPIGPFPPNPETVTHEGEA